MSRIYYGHLWTAPRAVEPALRDTFYFSGPASRRRTRVRHPFWVLDFTHTEAGLCRIGAPGNPWRRRRACTLHLYAPETDYWEDLRLVPHLQSTAVTFTSGEAGALERFLAPEAGGAEFEDPGERAGELLRAISRIGRDRGEAGFWQAQGRLCEIFDLLGQAEPLGPGLWRLGLAAPAAEAGTLAERTQAYLRAHLAEPVTLEVLARHLHVSPSTLSHRYRAETGQTPLATLNRLRLGQARLLLLRGQPLKLVAQATGFCDPFHLSRAFKRAEGVAPRRFLQQVRGSVEDLNEL